MGPTEHLKDFRVIELRRYSIQEVERQHFARYFESYFPEAFEQMGALIFGQFLERGNPAGFTWIRGFHDMEARATISEAFYSGPLWKEHASTMNDRMLDYTNVLLLRPLSADRGIPVLPAVDPVREVDGAHGVVVAQIFPIQAQSADELEQQVGEAFASYRTGGVREAGLLITLDVPNNFPRLPFRTDGPYLVSLTIIEDDRIFESRFTALAHETSRSLSAAGLLRDAPECIVLDPASRSRLRWVPEWRT